MAKSAIDYLRLLQALLPRGKAWNREEGSVLTEFLYGEGEEFARVDSRSDDLLVERDTRYANELLIDHEIDLGLPDECSPVPQTIQERRFAAHSKLIALGQQNPAYFIELAAAYGWIVTITEYTPCWCGVGGSGDPCGDQETIFYWKVTIEFGGGEIVYALSGSSECGDWIAYLSGIEAMICSLERYKPAHTVLIFGYEGAEFSSAYSRRSSFNAMLSGEEDYLYGEFWQGFGEGFDVHYGGEFDRGAFKGGVSGFRRPA